MPDPTGFTNSPTAVGAIVAVVFGGVELLKFTIGRLAPAKKNSNGAFNGADRAMLKGLHEAHEKTDADGRPLWYMPKSLVETQDKILDIQREQTEILKKISDSVQRMERLGDE